MVDGSPLKTVYYFLVNFVDLKVEMLVSSNGTMGHCMSKLYLFVYIHMDKGKLTLISPLLPSTVLYQEPSTGAKLSFYYNQPINSIF